MSRTGTLVVVLVEFDHVGVFPLLAGPHGRVGEPLIVGVGARHQLAELRRSAADAVARASPARTVGRQIRTGTGGVAAIAATSSQPRPLSPRKIVEPMGVEPTTS